jgi:hypothetical protein
MTTLVLSSLFDTTSRLLNGLGSYWTELLTDIHKGRAMALLYRTLSGLSDDELAARGLRREDIPGAVLAAFNGA